MNSNGVLDFIFKIRYSIRHLIDFIDSFQSNESIKVSESGLDIAFFFSSMLSMNPRMQFRGFNAKHNFL